ncbi:putative capsid protein [Dasychira pudibunda nucleopolyhedrovirus]|nr:putative capsid protein [Dasychira pudibunda nucleopolyhedrovirus]WHM28374.1 p15 [Dasychira pudibunda nucleopolyhedrovirus]
MRHCVQIQYSCCQTFTAWYLIKPVLRSSQFTMRTRSVNQDSKLCFFKALGLRPQEPLRRVACSVADKCAAKQYKRFKGVADIKRELGRFNLPPAQFNEALYLCRRHNEAWCTTDNWDRCGSVNERHVYEVDFDAQTKAVTERFYVCVQCFV